MTITATATAATALRMLPEADAAALCDAVTTAFAALPALVPGCRPVLVGMVYRIEHGPYWCSFGPRDGRPVILAAGRLAERKQATGKRARRG